MERITEENVTTTNIIHKFYCDDCGKYLGDRKECDDGYYSKDWEYRLSYYLSPFGYLSFKGDFCQDCRMKKTEQIYNTLLGIGFEHSDDL